MLKYQGNVMNPERRTKGILSQLQKANCSSTNIATSANSETHLFHIFFNVIKVTVEVQHKFQNYPKFYTITVFLILKLHHTEIMFSNIRKQQNEVMNLAVMRCCNFSCSYA